jgi:dipeptidyl aminopeptidase/acylaminoacyl peptidase
MSAFGNTPPHKIPYEAVLGSGDLPKVLGWSASAHVFLISSSNGFFTVDLKGKLTQVDIPASFSVSDSGTPFKVSPNGREWAIFGYGGLWIASPDHPSKQISSDRIDDILWSPDGSTLLYVSNSTLSQVSLLDYKVKTLTGPIPQWDSGSDSQYKLDWVMP